MQFHILITVSTFLQSHAGKVVERHWYEKNKHIFPASRWEVFGSHLRNFINMVNWFDEIHQNTAFQGGSLAIFLLDTLFNQA